MAIKMDKSVLNNNIIVICNKVRNNIIRIIEPSEHRAKLLKCLDKITLGSTKELSNLITLIQKYPPHIRDKFSWDIDNLQKAINNLSCFPQKPVDVVLLTALNNPELDEILCLPIEENKWKKFTFHGDPQLWYHGTFKKEHRNLSIVAASPDQLGMPAISVLTTKAIIQLRPTLIILCGIAAGVEGHTNIGDILAPERIFVHDSGKIINDSNNDKTYIFQPDRWTVMADSSLINDLKNNKIRYTAGIVERWETQKEKELPIIKNIRIHTSPLACGNVIVNSKERMKTIILNERKLCGLEMEGYALLFALRWTFPEQTRGLIFKSVCDFGYNKDDKYQKYAAWISAQFTYNFLIGSNVIDWDKNSI